MRFVGFSDVKQQEQAWRFLQSGLSRQTPPTAVVADIRSPPLPKREIPVLGTAQRGASVNTFGEEHSLGSFRDHVTTTSATDSFYAGYPRTSFAS